jgi:hypothetical protein
MINGKSICLNMIVSNESAVILRCLSAIRNVIDYWVIVDTGSTDGTQRLIRDYMHDIPGELHERVWVNFSHNRNQALNLARNHTDYILFIDADDHFIVSDSLFQAQLEEDFYMILLVGGRVIYHRILMINNHPGWAWEGVVHEYITTGSRVTGRILEGIVCEVAAEGGRRSLDPDKFEKDAKLLEQELEKDPKNSRNVFYLGQVYRAAGKLKWALKCFEQRCAMPDDGTEEVFWSLYLCGCLQQDLHMDPELFVNSYCRAHLKNPAQAEPLYRLSYYFNQTGNFILAYLLGKMAAAIPLPRFYSAIESAIYEYGAIYELTRSAYFLGLEEEARTLAAKLLLIAALPKAYKSTCMKIVA